MTEKIHYVTYQYLQMIKKICVSDPKCRLCGEPIKEGETAISKKKTSHRRNFYLYHEKCYEKLFIDL